jgi:hypothetical protein
MVWVSKLITPHATGFNKKENTMKYIIGASFMLLAISLAFNIYFASHVEMRVVLPHEMERISVDELDQRK